MGKFNFHEKYNRSEKLKIGSNRTFGFVMSAFFFIISFASFRKTGVLNYWFTALFLIFLIVSVLRPIYLKPLNVFWTKFGIFLGLIVSPIILFILYIIVVVPIGMVLKIFNKDILSLKKDMAANSYWIGHNAESTLNMKDQF